MKRLLMLKGRECASGDFTNGKIYDIIKDRLAVLTPVVYDDGSTDEESKEYEYTKENIEKYSEYEQSRWIDVKDDSSEDAFEVFDSDDRFIIFENDKELAHELIDRVEGLDKAIINLGLILKNGIIRAD